MEYPLGMKSFVQKHIIIYVDSDQCERAQILGRLRLSTQNFIVSFWLQGVKEGVLL